VTITTPFVAHYARTGLDHPRFMTDDDHAGVPNYIEKLAASANKAWLWYGHDGFHAPLPDTGAPDTKLDIYVKALPAREYGVAIPLRRPRTAFSWSSTTARRGSTWPPTAA
jgi:hypothetical protein